MAASVGLRNTNANKTRFAQLVDKPAEVYYSARTVHSAIHVFKANKRAVILTCPCTPVALELEKTQSGLYLWVAVCDGAVYRKSLGLSKNSATRNLGGQDVEMVDETSNQSIFDDLLKDQQQGPQTSSEILPDDFFLSTSGEVRDILVLTDFVILLCRGNDQIFLQWYSRNKLPSTEISAENIMPVTLPYRGSYSSHSDLSHELTSVQIVTVEDGESGLSSSMLQVPLHLFSALFGLETSVRSMPVLILGLRDGAVFSLPLDFVHFSRNEQEHLSFHGVVSLCEPPELTSFWKLMCCLTASIVGILLVRVNRKLTEKEAVAAELQKSLSLHTFTPAKPFLESLIILSSSGQCCLLTTTPHPSSTDGKLHGIVTTFTLPSSVVCCCSDEKNMFISTGRTLESCSLMVCQEGERERVQYKVEVTSEELHMASVVYMWLPDTDEQKTLMCETLNGDIVEFPTTSTVAPEMTGKTSQTSLKDVLVSIDVSSQKMEQLKSSHQDLDRFLQQMNIASHLLHFHDPGKPGDDSQFPVLCEVTLKSDTGYHTAEHFVVVKIKNQSTVALTSDWAIVVMLSEKRTCRPHSEMSKTDPCSLSSKSCPSSHTVPLSHGLTSSEDVCIKLPIDYSSSSVAIDVSVSLVLQYPRWLSEKDQASDSSSVLNRHASERRRASAVLAVSGYELLTAETADARVFIPVHSAVIDVLHFLQVRQPGSKISSTPVVLKQHALGNMMARLKQHQSGVDLEKTPKMQSGQSFSISIDIPESFSVQNKLTTSADHLNKILTDSQSDASVLTQSSCTLQDPLWSLLSVCVEKKSSPGSTGVDGSRSKDGSFVVVLKSSDVSLLARTRLALLGRFKKCPTEVKVLTVGDLQKIISTAENYQQQLQDVQEKMRRIDQDTCESLGALYESLRNLPL